MGQHTKISWCHSTANPWWGCEEVHAGCDHCYARVFAGAVGKADAWQGVRYAAKGVWANLRKWQRAAADAGEVHRVFTGSMMDIFEKSRPTTDWSTKQLDGGTTGELRDRYFREVVPTTPNLLHLLLTKRPGNILRMIPPQWLAPGGWPANVMTGTSPVDQATAETLIPQLLRVPGRHFLSVEPLLGPVDLENGDGHGYIWNYLTGEHWSPAHASRRLRGIDWVIIGGESGPNARPCQLDWIRDLVRQCRDAGTFVFVKQLGSRAIDEPNGVAGKRLNVPADALALVSIRLKDDHGGDWDEWPADLRIREVPDVTPETVAKLSGDPPGQGLLFGEDRP